jgi:hypothetical protein
MTAEQDKNSSRRMAGTVSVAVCEPLVRRTAEPGCRRAARSGEYPAPIWLAALLATRCLASGNGERHAVRWSCVSGRAVYTNAGADPELIQPLGVRLQGGHTLAVRWMPGETAYTMEVYPE